MKVWESVEPEINEAHRLIAMTRSPSTSQSPRSGRQESPEGAKACNGKAGALGIPRQKTTCVTCAIQSSSKLFFEIDINRTFNIEVAKERFQTQRQGSGSAPMVPEKTACGACRLMLATRGGAAGTCSRFKKIIRVWNTRFFGSLFEVSRAACSTRGDSQGHLLHIPLRSMCSYH